MDLVQAVPLAALAAYGCAMGLWMRRGRRWSWWAAASFALGIASLLVALSPAVEALDDTDARVHVVQHLLLMMIGPSLVCFGRPLRLLGAALAPRRRRALARVLAHGALQGVTGVPTWCAYFVVMGISFWPPCYRVELDHPLVHDALHVALVVVGLAYWQAVAEPARRWRRHRVVGTVAWLVAGMPLEAAIGLVLADTSRPLPDTSLAATHVAGQLFWMASMALSGAALAVVIWRWAAAEERVALATAAAAEARVSVPGSG